MVAVLGKEVLQIASEYPEAKQAADIATLDYYLPAVRESCIMSELAEAVSDGSRNIVFEQKDDSTNNGQARNFQVTADEIDGRKLKAAVAFGASGGTMTLYMTAVVLKDPDGTAIAGSFGGRANDQGAGTPPDVILEVRDIERALNSRVRNHCLE